MKKFAILSVDKRQQYIKDFLTKSGADAYIKTTMDFNNDDYIVCGTPFSKNNEYLNCDFYSSYPIKTFSSLLKPRQIVFGGNIPKSVIDINNVKFVDVLADENVVWNNSMLTAEGLISKIIENTDYSICNSCCLIIGFGKCGTNIASRLQLLGCEVTIYDHTPAHLSQAESFGYKTQVYENLIYNINNFDFIINTVENPVLKQEHFIKIKSTCSIFDIASGNRAFDKELLQKYNLSLITCPGLPGATSPKSAGELIAKSIISYLERNEINGAQFQR